MSRMEDPLSPMGLQNFLGWDEKQKYSRTMILLNNMQP